MAHFLLVYELRAQKLETKQADKKRIMKKNRTADFSVYLH